MTGIAKPRRVILLLATLITTLSAPARAASAMYLAAQPQDASSSQSQSLDREQIMAQLHDARELLLRMQREQSPSWLDVYHAQTGAIRALKLANNSLEIQAQSDQALQQATEDLLTLALKMRVFSASSIENAFRTIKLLPDSSNKSLYILSALEASRGNPAYVWNLRLHEQVSDQDFAVIFHRVSNAEELQEIQLSDIALLAARGRSEDIQALKQLLDWSRRYETSQGHRAPSGRRPVDFERLIDLQDARHDPELLLLWAAGGPESVLSPESSWALAVIYNKVGADADIWARLWKQLEHKADAYAETVLTLTTDLSMPEGEYRDLSKANLLKPWVQWAHAHDLAVPASIEDLLARTPAFPMPSAN